MFTAPNPGPKTLTGTHTFLVGSADAYVVDPGPDLPSYQRDLAERLSTLGVRVRALLLTHGHPDHAPGAAQLAALLSVPVHASSSLDEQDARVKISRRFLPADRYTPNGDVLRVVPAPGHSGDHVAFWLEKARILFAGDTVLGEGSTLVAPPEGDMLAYMETLERFRRLDPALIAPGHGPLVRDPLAKLDEYVEHRRMRERNLVNALAGGPASVEELVSHLYADVDPDLHDLARGSILAQLAKLESEGRVERDGDVYRLGASPPLP
jgi:glyoxylase-like metal-dependent hydrolase (beta-lactamase superfamily II)